MKNNYKTFFTWIFFVPIILILFFSYISTVSATATTTLLPSTTLSSKMKTIANNGTPTSSDATNTNVTAIKKANTKKEGLTDSNVISTSDSEEKVYMWFENNTLYYYSDADTIYMNSNSSYAFRTFKNLVDISGLQYFDTSRVTNMGRLFIDSINLENLSPLANWDTSNVTNMYFTFGSNYTGSSGTPMKISDISPIANWNTSNVTTMNSMFKGCINLKNVDAIKNWDTSNVTSMAQMFNRTGLTDITGIKNWDVNSVTDFNMMLANIPSTTIKPIFTYRAGRWNSNGTYTPNPKIDITITVNWTDTSHIPTNVKIYLKKQGETYFITSNDSNWTKNGNIWTYVFPVYDSATYYVWQENIDYYLSDATESSPKTVTNNSATITNYLSQHNITLKSKVTGNMSSIYNNFEYTVYLFDKNDNPLTGTVKINDSENVTLTNGSFTKNLKNGETLTINNIADGCKYKVIQTDSDYDEKYIIEKNGTIIEDESNETITSILSEDQTVKFTNNKEAAIQTGINTEELSLIILQILIGLIGIGGLFLFQKIDKLLKK